MEAIGYLHINTITPKSRLSDILIMTQSRKLESSGYFHSDTLKTNYRLENILTVTQ